MSRRQSERGKPLSFFPPLDSTFHLTVKDNPPRAEERIRSHRLKYIRHEPLLRRLHSPGSAETNLGERTVLRLPSPRCPVIGIGDAAAAAPRSNPPAPKFSPPPLPQDLAVGWYSPIAAAVPVQRSFRVEAFPQ